MTASDWRSTRRPRPPARAQRDPNADLPRPLGDLIEHDAVESNGHEAQTDRAKKRSERRRDALARQRGIDRRGQ